MNFNEFETNLVDPNETGEDTIQEGDVLTDGGLGTAMDQVFQSGEGVNLELNPDTNEVVEINSIK